MTTGSRATLLVLAKSPRPGRVKTRLCPPCSSEQAAEIAAAALGDTLETVAATPAVRRILVLDGPVGPWLPTSGFSVISQVPGGLGDRLAAAFSAVRGPAFLVGMDTPQLTVADLTGALDHLASPDVDAVMGPATDGGWWGLGLNRADPRVFAGVPMSSSRTGAAQLAALGHLGLRAHLLPDRCDVDCFSDARAVAARVPGSRFAAAVARVESTIALGARSS